MAIRVIIIEDIQSIREGLEIILSESPGMECVGSFANAECALKSIRVIDPDVVLVDMHMPGNKSAEIVQWLKPLVQQAHFVICAVSDDSDEVVEALRAGASGYVLKSKTPFNWVESIKHLVCGQAVMPSAVASNILKSMPSKLY
jgi:DNA-binding NarL/FixJ family response regulator